MRLFVAIDPPAEAVDSLHAVLPSDDRLRWTAADRWHITLAFLGEVGESRVSALTERLGRAAARSAPMRLRLLGAGAFGRQVLWCGVDGDVDGLSRLAERCRAAARRSSIPVEDRPFRPHVTLARARGRGADLRDVARTLSAYAGPWWTAGEMRLVQSHLGPPLVHENLVTFDLSGPAVAVT